MTEKITKKPALKLPTMVNSMDDIDHLLHEIEQIDEFLRHAGSREPGTPIDLPKPSRALDELSRVNELNLLQDKDRARIWGMLLALKAKAPTLQISFSEQPTPAFTQKLITWLRDEIHPMLLLKVGLQPNIGIGFVVRGHNLSLDFSLRDYFRKQRTLLFDELRQGLPPVTSEPNKVVDKSVQTEQKDATEKVSVSVASTVNVKAPKLSSTPVRNPVPQRPVSANVPRRPARPTIRHYQ
ncbi:hypothetical protein KC968_02795 [Candidatus Saccharibacteria bacterium]|nr:hypothetical protein [Candidatus Saccharibacteria bacterium]